LSRNSLFIIAVIVLGLGGAAYTISKNAGHARDEAEQARDLAELRNDYLEHVGFIRSEPDPEAYRSDVKSFLEAYFKSVDAHVAKWGLNKNYDDYLTELAQRGGDRDGYKQNYETVKALFDQMRQGHYRPVWTATDKGMRLDVLSDEVEGDKVRLVLVLWGAQRQMHEEDRQGGGKLLKMVTSASFNASWKLYDRRGKEYGEMSGGEPSGKIDYPERYVAFFPPQVVIGHYDVDRVPAAVEKMDITLSVASSAPTGGTALASFVWKLDSIPPEWKLASGQPWKGATETVRAE
jgi:hypothetical protein